MHAISNVGDNRRWKMFMRWMLILEICLHNTLCLQILEYFHFSTLLWVILGSKIGLVSYTHSSSYIIMIVDDVAMAIIKRAISGPETMQSESDILVYSDNFQGKNRRFKQQGLSQYLKRSSLLSTFAFLLPFLMQESPVFSWLHNSVHVQIGLPMVTGTSLIQKHVYEFLVYCNLVRPCQQT